MTVVSQQLFHGWPVSAKLLEIDVRLRCFHPTTVDDAFSLTPLEMLVFAILSQRTVHHNALLAYANLRREFSEWLLVCMSPTPPIERAIDAATWPDQKALYLQSGLTHIRGWRRGALDLDHLFKMSDVDASVWLERLPGVARKTSACVLLFSTMRRAVLPVDTGHLRMKKRLGLLAESIASDPAHPILQA